MLILTRQAGEAITIGDGVRIVVLGVDRRGVRIGIVAGSGIGSPLICRSSNRRTAKTCLHAF